MEGFNIRVCFVMRFEIAIIILNIGFTIHRVKVMAIDGFLLYLRESWVESVICLWGEIVIFNRILLESEEIIVKGDRIDKEAHVDDSCTDKCNVYSYFMI